MRDERLKTLAILYLARDVYAWPNVLIHHEPSTHNILIHHEPVTHNMPIHHEPIMHGISGITE